MTLAGSRSAASGQEAELGKANSQYFQQIPFARFVEMLHYKAALVGIQFEVVEESYTSKETASSSTSVARHLS